MSDTATLDGEIQEAFAEYESARKKLLALQRQAPAVDVTEYTFQGPGGEPVKIGELFGDSDELLLIHNMGGGCAYCTLWADGFNGMLPYLSSRSAFAVMSADPPEKMANFAQSRGWKFKMVSGADSRFADDLGKASKEWGMMPGASALKREADGRILHTAWTEFGPGDLFCPSWHLFDLLPNGVGDWEPKYNR